MPIATIDPFDLYQSFQSYVNTYIGGWFRPQTDFIIAGNDISNDIWEMKTKQAEKSQEVVDDLGFLLRSKNRLVTPANSNYGIFVAPDDYGRYASARIIVEDGKCIPCRQLDEKPNKVQGQCDETNTEDQDQITAEYFDRVCERQIDKIDNQRWGAICEHLTKCPTLDNPKLTQISQEVPGKNGTPIKQISFKVAPRTVSVVVLDYYIRPPRATFNYTMAAGNIQTGAGDQIIYNKNSTPFPWPTTMVNEFLIRLGERYGLFTRDQFVAQTSTQQKTLK